MRGRLLALVLLIGGANGCGYHSLNARAHMGISSICIMPFAESGPAGITGKLSHELGQALAAQGFVIEPDAARADGVLTGQIELNHLPGTTLQTVQLYTVDVEVSAELWGRGHEPVWQEAVSLQEDFLPTDAGRDIEPLVTERRRRVALHRLMERAAEALVQSMQQRSLTDSPGP